MPEDPTPLLMFWQPKIAHCREFLMKSWSSKQITYLHMAGIKLKSQRSCYFILSTPTPSMGSKSCSGSYCQGCQDWEMCNTFQRSKVVSLWCQTTHLIWLNTCQFNFSNQTTPTIKPYQTDSVWCQIDLSSQTNWKAWVTQTPFLKSG